MMRSTVPRPMQAGTPPHSTQRVAAPPRSTTITRQALPSRRRLAIALAAFLFVGTVAIMAAAAPAHASDADYLGRINALRSSHGLAPLQIDGNMDSLAQQHTQQMASQQSLFHTASLTAGVTSNWTKLGENVGYGGTTDEVWNAFLNSPKHLANLLDPAYTHVGIGVVVDANGVQWTTHRFVAIAASSPVPQAPPPTAAPVTAPPVTRPPVTAPRVVAPRPVVTTTPPTTAPPVTAPPETADASTAADGDGAGAVPANPGRVGSVIDSLRALN